MVFILILPNLHKIHNRTENTIALFPSITNNELFHHYHFSHLRECACCIFGTDSFQMIEVHSTRKRSGTKLNMFISRRFNTVDECADELPEDIVQPHLHMSVFRKGITYGCYRIERIGVVLFQGIRCRHRCNFSGHCRRGLSQR